MCPRAASDLPESPSQEAGLGYDVKRPFLVSTSALLTTLNEPLSLSWASVYPPGTAGDGHSPQVKHTETLNSG